MSWRLAPAACLFIVAIVLPAALLPNGPAGDSRAVPRVTLKVTETVMGEYKPFKGGQFVFSPDNRRAAWTAERVVNGRRSLAVVVDGREGKQTYDRVEDLCFSSGGRRVAFRATRGDDCLVVVDGAEGKAYFRVKEFQFSADGTRVGYIAVGHSTEAAVIDGQEGTPYISVDDLTFSADGKHSAYIGLRRNKPTGPCDFVVVKDGVESTGYRYVERGSLRISADGMHMAFAQHVIDEMTGRDKIRVIVDGVPAEKPYDELVSGHNGNEPLLFSPDGRRFAYAVSKNGKDLVVVDDKEGNLYDAVEELTLRFSPDGRRFAYVADRGAKQLAVVDGKESAPYDQVSNVHFSADGQHFYYAAGPDGEQCLVMDGRPGKPYIRILSVRFSPDGRHIAYAADRDKGGVHAGYLTGDLLVVSDGREGKPYRQVWSDGLGITPDGQHVQYMAESWGTLNGPDTKPVFVVDGIEERAPRSLDLDPDTLVYSADGRRSAYIASTRKGTEEDSYYVVVDGVVSERIDPPLGDSKPVFDGPNRLYLIAVRGEKFVRVQIDISDH